MDKQKTQQIGDKALAALQAVAEEYGVQVVSKGGKYGPGSCELKFEFAEVGDDGIVNDKAAEDFRFNAVLFGLQETDLGRTFRFRGQEYTVTGCKPRSTKYPILAKAEDGKTYKFAAEDIKRFLQDAA